MRRKKEMAWNFILPILLALKNGKNRDAADFFTECLTGGSREGTETPVGVRG
jgi:hypothetical protein